MRYSLMLKEALLYKKLDGRKVSCFLCSHHCLISDGNFGICQARQNKGGTLYTYAYGEVVAASIDPIEKKPIFHILPGSRSFSIASIGCNFRCGFCQNWQISQKKEADKSGVGQTTMNPEEIVANALKYKCESISYTYTEPTIFFEYALETAKSAKEKGLYNIFVTNGYMTKEALEMVSPYLDGANVDLKFFDDGKYRKICGGRLKPVMESIELMRKMNIWVEVTTLVVPGENDSVDELKGIASFLAGAGKEIPWHISRFHPDYKMTDLEATSLSTLKEAYKIGKDAGLRYVYIGNVLKEEKTYCYQCGRDLISRIGFNVIRNNLKEGRCPECNALLDGKGL
jgi:pyruvate formate lyase activating enzyme